jgi:hypothetical protein
MRNLPLKLDHLPTQCLYFHTHLLNFNLSIPNINCFACHQLIKFFQSQHLLFLIKLLTAHLNLQTLHFLGSYIVLLVLLYNILRLSMVVVFVQIDLITKAFALMGETLVQRLTS